MTTVRLHVIADDPLVRAGLVTLLTELPDCIVSGQSGSEALADGIDGENFHPTPDAIVWDLGWDVNEFLPDLEDPGYPIVALLADEVQAVDAWNAGITALLRRDAMPERIPEAARAACQGLIVLDPELTRTLLPAGHLRDTASTEELTPRELEVLQHLAEGLTNRAIAQQLEISDHTVKFHVNAIMTKLQAQSRTEAVVRATRAGLISL